MIIHDPFDDDNCTDSGKNIYWFFFFRCIVHMYVKKAVMDGLVNDIVIYFYVPSFNKSQIFG